MRLLFLLLATLVTLTAAPANEDGPVRLGSNENAFGFTPILVASAQAAGVSSASTEPIRYSSHSSECGRSMPAMTVRSTAPWMM